MTLYRLRDKATMMYYQGSGKLSKKGKLYTNKGFIKNSLKQSGVKNLQDFEIVTYELNETKVEDLV